MKNISKTSLIKIWLQIFFILLTMYLFILSSIISTGGIHWYTKRKIVLFVVFSIGIFFCLIKIIKLKFFSLPKIFKFIKNNICLLLIVFIALLIRIPQLGTMPKWDAQAYYNFLSKACESINFTVSNFINNFSLAAHSSIAYASLSAILEFIAPNTVWSVQIFQLILALTLVIGIYSVLKFKLKLDSGYAAIFSLCVTSTPLFLGTYSYYQLDYGLAVFLILVMVCQINKLYLLTGYFSIILTQTKEVGTILLAGYLIGLIVSQLVCNKKIMPKKIITVIRNPEIYIIGGATCLGGLYLIYTLFIKKSGWNLDSSSNTPGYFSFDGEYILFKLWQIFSANFLWIAWIIIVVCIVYLVITHKLITNFKGIVGLVGSVLAFIIFSVIFVTYPLIRYNIVIEIPIWIIALFLLTQCLKKCFRKMFLILLSILFCIQAYITIDPVMLSTYQKVETGGGDSYCQI
ncbi:hypothetical protein [Murimonas intestini]|uniref:hypothetical protein n=1 Tax=Murimonas intestini TaxID=1337051 RepID=UPI00214C421E|nr:hypothetical protein [Murimonas intestini]MCR1839493.1 hypothetical protein [Murimonas intestini]